MHKKLVIVGGGAGGASAAAKAKRLDPDLEVTILEAGEHVPAQQKWFAFGEALAHLIFLESEGRVHRQPRGDKILYSISQR